MWESQLFLGDRCDVVAQHSKEEQKKVGAADMTGGSAEDDGADTSKHGNGGVDACEAQLEQINLDAASDADIETCTTLLKWLRVPLAEARQAALALERGDVFVPVSMSLPTVSACCAVHNLDKAGEMRVFRRTWAPFHAQLCALFIGKHSGPTLSKIRHMICRPTRVAWCLFGRRKWRSN